MPANGRRDLIRRLKVNVKLTLLSFLFVWVRGTIPRFRYDRLMYLAWRRFSPLSLNYYLLFVGVNCFILCFITFFFIRR